MSKSKKMWVRSTSFASSVVGTSLDNARVQSLRDASITNSVLGVTQFGLPNEFTVVRFLGWWQVESTDTAAGVVTNPAPCYFGARPAGTEEIEEMSADANFRTESGPQSDPLEDWMFWNPAFPANAAFGTGTQETFIGKGSFDIRSSRRVDSFKGDIAIMAQFPVSSLTTTTQSFRLSWAALCIV